MPFGLLLVLLCLGLFKAGILFALEFALLRSVLAKLKPPRLTLGLLAKLALIATGFSLPPDLLIQKLLLRYGYMHFSIESSIVLLFAAGWFVSGLVPLEQGRGEFRRAHLVLFLVGLGVILFRIYAVLLAESIIRSS
ncbi:hypothetical protein KDL44_02560 [bacterium]|nr:hypothetical protein [bacterium]